MKNILAGIMLCAMFTGCKPKVLEGVELQNKLIETMNDYLKKEKPGIDFTVIDVIYFPDAQKQLYLCHFQVNMHYNNKDTVGLMVATITSDFSKVIRTQ